MAQNQLQGVKVGMNSCHAAIEKDFFHIWKYLGISVSGGNLDRSHLERPALPDYPTPEWDDEPKERIMNKSPDLKAEDFGDADFVQIVNPSDFQERVPHFAQFKPTLMYLNGQWVDDQLYHFCGQMNKQWEEGKVCTIGIACYSKHEEDFLRGNIHTQLQGRIKHIRFAKRVEDYAPWVLDKTVERPKRENFVYTTNHSIHHRPDSCMFPQWNQTVSGFNHVLTGRHTEEIGYKGLVSFDELRRYMQTCAVYVGVPCWPAPIVLNFIEAMMTGAPVVFFDNSRGVASEGIFSDGVGCLTAEVATARRYIEQCINDEGFRNEQSSKCMARAHEFFKFESNSDRWGELIDDLLNNKIQK